MDNKTENTDCWIGRVFIIFFLLLILSFSNNDANSPVDRGSVSFEQSDRIDNFAILNDPVRDFNYNISLINCELNDLLIRDYKFERGISNDIINLRIKSEEKIFLNYKPNIIRSNLIHLISFSHKDYPSIS